MNECTGDCNFYFDKANKLEEQLTIAIQLLTRCCNRNDGYNCPFPTCPANWYNTSCEKLEPKMWKEYLEKSAAEFNKIFER